MKISLRRIVFSSLLFIVVFVAVLIYVNLGDSKQVIATTGKNSLPVALKNFSGTIEENTIELSWVTESEINNDYFTIERSDGGHDFYEIGRVQGAGNSTIENLYKLTDEMPLKGDSYYRICQTTTEGTTFKFNPVHMILNSPGQGLQISYCGPNPFEDNLRVDYHSEESGVVEIRLVNSTGQSIRNEQVITESGFNSFIFGGMASLKKGIYLIQLLQGNNKIASLKVING